MYLCDLHIQNLKLLRDFRLSFLEDDGSPRMWTVLIGENGTAKTSILQAIAMSAAGRLQVNSLAKAAVGHLRDRRQDQPELRVDAAFGEPDCDGVIPSRFGTRVSLKRHESTIRAEDREIEGGGGRMNMNDLDSLRASNEAGMFVAAYGVSRFLPDPLYSGTLQQPAIERMESLFQPRAALHSLAFADAFPAGGDPRRAFATVLRDALKRHPMLAPAIDAIELRGAGGVGKAHDLLERDRFTVSIGGKQHKLPATALSHGYQSTIAWVADLIGHAMLEDPHVEAPTDIKGIVLVDEIDAFLHPVWQAGLVDALRTVFPKVQFIVSTHSPVILAGVRPHEIVRLGHEQAAGDVVRLVHDPDTGDLVAAPVSPARIDTSGEPDPRMLTGTAIYRDWFGLDRLTLHPHGSELQEYTRLAADPLRDAADDKRLTALKKTLKSANMGELPPPVRRRSTEPRRAISTGGKREAGG